MGAPREPGRNAQSYTYIYEFVHGGVYYNCYYYSEIETNNTYFIEKSKSYQGKNINKERKKRVKLL